MISPYSFSGSCDWHNLVIIMLFSIFFAIAVVLEPILYIPVSFRIVSVLDRRTLGKRHRTPIALATLYDQASGHDEGINLPKPPLTFVTSVGEQWLVCQAHSDDEV